MYKIIIDSCGELNEKMKQDSHFANVPLTLEVDGEDIIDDASFDQTSFLAKVAASPTGPKSACPSPSAYMDEMEDAEHIYIVTLSAQLSGSYNSACLAKDLFEEEHEDEDTEFKVHVFDSKSASIGQTLIGLKIQECEEAITALKFWAVDNRYDVIVSGSLLGIDYKRASSYPVGYVDYQRMYGLDFEEFLWGIGITEEMIDSLKACLDKKQPVPTAINDQMFSYYRQYLATGGMPEAVQKYLDTKDYREVDTIQRSLLQGYLYDIAHYATAEEKVKAEKCYLTLGKQLLDKENHKFQYKEIEKGARAQKYYNSIDWLLRADMVHLSRIVTDIRYDLDDYARNDFFRAYTTDLSLLVAMKDFSLKQHIVENTLEGNTKGGIYECAVADALHKLEGIHL